MTSLRELQRDFMTAVLDATPDTALQSGPTLVPEGIAHEPRLNIYRTNARSNFSNALALSYPVILRLVGADYFAQCARGFQREHPSWSGDLQPAGAGFANYLGALHPEGDYRYLDDVARFEWCVQEAVLAADHDALDLKKLAAVPPGEYERLEFHLHPSLQLFESDFPCLRIWRTHLAEGEPPFIDMSSSPRERLAILCARGNLEFLALCEADMAFLAALRTPTPFAAVLEAMAERKDRFDASATLQRFVAAAVIVDF